MRFRFRRGVLRLGLLGLLVGGVMLTGLVGSATAADPPAGCTTTAGVTTCVFAYRGAAQTWTVPDGVTEATFDLYGAQGGGVGVTGLSGGSAVGPRRRSPSRMPSRSTSAAGLHCRRRGFNGGGNGLRGGGRCLRHPYRRHHARRPRARRRRRRRRRGVRFHRPGHVRRGRWRRIVRAARRRFGMHSRLRVAGLGGTRTPAGRPRHGRRRGKRRGGNAGGGGGGWYGGGGGAAKPAAAAAAASSRRRRKHLDADWHPLRQRPGDDHVRCPAVRPDRCLGQGVRAEAGRGERDGVLDEHVRRDHDRRG